MSDSKSTSSGGISAFGLLWVAGIILKVVGYLESWSWWVVAGWYPGVLLAILAVLFAVWILLLATD